MIWTVPSFTDKNKSYIVERTVDGEYTCTCPYFEYRLMPCKHIDAVLSGDYEPYIERRERSEEIRDKLIDLTVERLRAKARDCVLYGQPVDPFNWNELMVAAYYIGAIEGPPITLVEK